MLFPPLPLPQTLDAGLCHIVSGADVFDCDTHTTRMEADVL